MLTAEQIEQYEQDGYTFVRNVLEPHVLQQLRDVTDRIIESAAEVAEHTNVLDLEASHTPEHPRVRRIKQPHLVDDFYRDLAAYRRIMDALIPLMGKHIRLRAGGKINITDKPSIRKGFDGTSTWIVAVSIPYVATAT